MDPDQAMIQQILQRGNAAPPDPAQEKGTGGDKLHLPDLAAIHCHSSQPSFLT